ncbi:uncharacterized zinc finger CCHC domain-containing protein At4g19190-like isoform X1 [Miscanthus floridulus]|uniref:uncharacterized zinc finger CCHC domain-containing protein At4g19190-like isoform X1 n=2 Tax=Miscanthus floridulus TaxID=154761 RepID=UPI00345849B0
MEEEVTGSGGGIGRKMAAGEVELKEKSGTAWSHSYLNQKPWHPLSYPNQRRKWIAEQVHANHARRQEEVQREFAQEQEFFRQTALFSKKDKEKMEVMKAVSFMYVRPPGYNAESAKAAEIEDEKKRSDPGDMAQGTASASTSSIPDKGPEKTQSGADKKNRPKDVFGRPLATEQEFEVLKNAPRLDTGAPARIKPFGVEVRNVRCLRCGNYGHQSGDRECPLKDVIMPNEESRLKRDDPLTTIMAQTDSSEPLKWELKQKPGMSPPRGGFDPDDPNQQIVAEDIFDEYGGFLNCDIPALISNFSASKSKKRSKKKSKHKQAKSAIHEDSGRHESSYHLSSDSENEKRNKTSRSKRKKTNCSDSSYSDSEIDARKGKSKSKHRHKKKYQLESSSDSEFEVREDTRRHLKREHVKEKRDESPFSFSKDQGDTESKRHSRRSREKRHYSYSSSSSERGRHSLRHKEKQYYSDSSSDRSHRHSRRSREKRHDRESSSPDAIRRSRRSMEKQRHSDTSPRHTNRHSKRSSGKQDYTERSHFETSRHSWRSREKRHYPDSSASDYSDSDQHNKHRHHHRRK